jgi:hypothetical protein
MGRSDVPLSPAVACSPTTRARTSWPREQRRCLGPTDSGTRRKVLNPRGTAVDSTVDRIDKDVRILVRGHCMALCTGRSFWYRFTTSDRMPTGAACRRW